MPPKRRRTLLVPLTLVALLAGIVQAPLAHAAPAVLTVNSTGDGVDETPNDGVCETALGNGVCTLRAAIQTTTFSSVPGGFDNWRIEFNIAGTAPFVISPASELPGVTWPNVDVDATSQPGFTPGGTPVVQVDGTGAPAGANGLMLQGQGESLKGFSVTNFGGAGIRSTDDNNSIHGNYAGVAPDGVSGGANGIGISVLQANDNTVQGNLVSANTTLGIQIQDSSNTVVKGNLVGT
jgi:CSLREA domain-containing protein